VATFAVMGGNTVSTVIVADNKEETEAALGVVLIEYTPENPAGIGWIYDETTNKFTAPVVVDPVVTANDKLIAAGLAQEEINTLIQDAVLAQPTTEEGTNANA
jgi:uncharacterized protein YbjT (DUF2867 family)